MTGSDGLFREGGGSGGVGPVQASVRMACQMQGGDEGLRRTQSRWGRPIRRMG